MTDLATYYCGTRIWHCVKPPPSKPSLTVVLPPSPPEAKEQGWPPKPELKSVA